MVNLAQRYILWHFRVLENVEALMIFRLGLAEVLISSNDLQANQDFVYSTRNVIFAKHNEGLLEYLIVI